MRGNGSESPHDPIPFPGLGHGMVHLEDANPFDPGDPIGTAVEAGSEDDDLLDATAERCAQGIVDVSRPDRHCSPGAVPVSVDERPRKRRADER
jgi:hypothetical protein